MITGGVTDRLVREHNERMALAWHIEALHRSKRLPKLNTLLAKTASRKRQTWQEQQAVMSQWADRMKMITESQKTLRKKKR